MKIWECTLMVIMVLILLRGCTDRINSNEAAGRLFRDWHDQFVVGYNYK